MGRKVTFEKWMVLSVVLFLAMGCQLAEGATEEARVVPSPVKGLVVETTSLPAAGLCQVAVYINQPAMNLDVAVHVEAESAIRFMDSQSWQSKPISVSMMAGETRGINFDCQLVAENVRLSGEYIVRAVAVHQGSGATYQTAEAKLYILVGENNTAPSFTSQAEWNRQMTEGFVAGGGNLHYRFDFESAPSSVRGRLYLKIVGDQPGFSPEVAAKVRGGINFVPGQAKSTEVAILSTRHIQVRFGLIAQSGSRIAVVPFEMEAGSLVGTYMLEVVEDDMAVNEVAAWKECAPIVVEVVAAADAPGQHGLRGAPSPLANAEPVTATADDLTSFFPGRPAPIAEAATFVPLVPAATPSSATAAAVPTAAPTVMPAITAGAPIIQAGYVWDRHWTHYSGTCGDLYSQQIEGKIDLTWEVFQAAVVQRNPDLANSGCKFEPFKVYWLPGEPAQVMETVR